jgi:hypothetical protein
LLGPFTPGTEERKTLRVLDVAFNGILGVGIIVFESYAYILQVTKLRGGDRLTWIALILTVVLVVSGLAITVQYNKAAE